MFKILYRMKKILFKTQNEYDKGISKLFLDEKKIDIITIFIHCLFFIIPLLFIMRILEKQENILSVVTAIIVDIIFMIAFVKSSNKITAKLLTEGTIISNFLFFSIYTLKGNAISRKECKEIKRYDKSLYCSIRTRNCTGFCYQVCYDILCALKKGSIIYIAIKATEVDNIKNEFTLHVIYVNEDWCFDTNTRKQYKVEEFMNLYRAKEYKAFLYNDVAGKSYHEFKEDIHSEVKKWCIENDCHQKVF